MSRQVKLLQEGMLALRLLEGSPQYESPLVWAAVGSVKAHRPGNKTQRPPS